MAETDRVVGVVSCPLVMKSQRRTMLQDRWGRCHGRWGRWMRRQGWRDLDRGSKMDVVVDEAQFIAEEVQADVLDVAVDLVGVVQSVQSGNSELSQIWSYLKHFI